jgi:hypothetical protein
MDAEEVKWRVTLQTGQEIDVLKYDPKCKTSMWSIGKIVDMVRTDLDENHPSANLVKEHNNCTNVP